MALNLGIVGPLGGALWAACPNSEHPILVKRCACRQQVPQKHCQIFIATQGVAWTPLGFRTARCLSVVLQPEQEGVATTGTMPLRKYATVGLAGVRRVESGLPPTACHKVLKVTRCHHQIYAAFDTTSVSTRWIPSSCLSARSPNDQSQHRASNATALRNPDHAFGG